MKKGCAIFSILIIISIIIGGYFGIKFYKKYYGSNVAKEGYVLIPRHAEYEAILDSIAPYIKNEKTFLEVAKQKKLQSNFKVGRYKIESGASNTQIINMIKAGNQTPLDLRVANVMDVYQLLGRVSRKTETDSLTFVKEFDKIAKEKGLNNAEDLKKYFFSDTYQFFWTVTPEEFFKKFEKDYLEFWTEDRNEKEEKSGLTRNQIYALASIVLKESGGKPDEMKTIAGLYLNRYRKGMKLQSDPTVIYAVNKDSNFKRQIKRVLFKDLKAQSPYNTYLNKGIPPGPICIVDKTSVDAVLDAEHNNYIFMCADPQRLGYHKFTASDTEHAKNAKAYQDWLSSKNINK